MQDDDVLNLAITTGQSDQSFNRDDWERAMNRKTPGRKQGPHTARFHTRMTPETVKSLKSLADEKKISVGALVERLYQHWKDNPADIFEQQASA